MDTWCTHQNIVPPLLEWILSRAEYTRTDRLLITNCITGQMWPAGRTSRQTTILPTTPTKRFELSCCEIAVCYDPALGPKTSQTHFLFSDYWGTIKLADHTLEV